MKYVFFLFIILFLSNCSKPKTVLICGDHVCVNKQEAEQFFEENLSLEVKIIDLSQKKNIDLVELNLNESPNGTRKINVVSKENTIKNLKKLSNKEIIKIKNDIKQNKNKKKVVKRVIKIDETKNKKDLSVNKANSGTNSNANVSTFFSTKKKNKDVIDVCNILKECNIDEITKYLLEQGSKKDYPNISKK